MCYLIKCFCSVSSTFYLNIDNDFDKIKLQYILYNMMYYKQLCFPSSRGSYYLHILLFHYVEQLIHGLNHHSLSMESVEHINKILNNIKYTPTYKDENFENNSETVCNFDVFVSFE